MGLMTTVVRGAALTMTEVLVEAWTTSGVPGVALMMTGAQEEEMMKEVEGEGWMMGHVAAVTTPNPGSPWADLADGVRGRRHERIAGVLPVTTNRREMTMTERKETASETVVLQERTPGEEEPPMKEAAGEMLAKKSPIAWSVVTGMIAVTVMTDVTEIAAIETAGMTVSKEPRPETKTMEALGVVEVRKDEKSATGSNPERRKGSERLTEKGVGALTRKTFVAPRTRQMMMAGPLSAARQQPLHPIIGYSISQSASVVN